MVRVAFSEELIQDGTVSNPIEIAPGHSVVIRVTGHTAERALTLDEVRERVVAEIRGDRMHEAAEAEADAMVAKLAGGESLSRSEEHTSELQSLMRISYAVFCLKKQNKHYQCH